VRVAKKTVHIQIAEHVALSIHNSIAGNWRNEAPGCQAEVISVRKRKACGKFREICSCSGGRRLWCCAGSCVNGNGRVCSHDEKRSCDRNDSDMVERDRISIHVAPQNW
jgi:hypothetical protein